jgi:L-aspartate oxidase
MGGIATDLDGRASLPGLFAVGECSCTGLHGANRLASNSLTECFVFGARAGRAALDEPAPAAATADQVDRERSPTGPVLERESREALWRDAGIERDGAGLQALLTDPHPLVRLIASSALTRAESRGAHLRRDFPQTDSAFENRHVVLRRDREPELAHWA